MHLNIVKMKSSVIESVRSMAFKISGRVVKSKFSKWKQAANDSVFVDELVP